MKRKQAAQMPGDCEIRCDGVTVKRYLYEYVARSEWKWRIARENPNSHIEVVHTPTATVLDTAGPAGKSRCICEDRT